jgi:hypothetical protein
MIELFETSKRRGDCSIKLVLAEVEVIEFLDIPKRRRY